MSFLKNSWYLIAWADEVKADALFHRTVINEPVLLYRDKAGVVVAIANRCPHRFAPLHMGKLVGDSVECPYHGLQFDRNGACSHNPHGDGKAPRTAKVRSFPSVEKDRGIWIWMGDEAPADKSLIPDYSFMNQSPETSVITGYLWTKANYELLSDNIMDLSHADYLHVGSLGTGGEVGRTPPKVSQQGNRVFCNWWLPNAIAAPAFASLLPDPEAPADSWLEVEWSPAANLLLTVGATLEGCSRSDGVEAKALHIMTPETDGTTHYFYSNARNFLMDDSKFTEELREILIHAFTQEDKPMIEAQQEMMGTTDFWSLKPALFGVDVGPVKVRQVLLKMIKDEVKSEVLINN